MTKRSVVHSTFAIERIYPATPARVFNAFADPAEKARWFSGPDDWSSDEVAIDFREGGREINRGGPKGGPISAFEAIYQDIVPNERIVYSYDMHLDGIRLSISLTTIQFQAHGAGTRLMFTEQGAFFDGHEDPALRENGTRDALDALGAALEREPATA